MQPTRRSYSKSFKAQVIHECAQPGASIACIALSHSLNANLAHKWIRLQAQKSTALQSALVPLPVPLTGANLHPASSNIFVEIQHPRGTVKVNWPTENAACATFLRDLLAMIRIDSIWLATEPMEVPAATEKKQKPRRTALPPEFPRTLLSYPRLEIETSVLDSPADPGVLHN